MYFNMTVILTISPPMTTDDGYFRTIFWTYLQVIRCIGEEKPACVLYRLAPSKIAAGTILMHVV